MEGKRDGGRTMGRRKGEGRKEKCKRGVRENKGDWVDDIQVFCVLNETGVARCLLGPPNFKNIFYFAQATHEVRCHMHGSCRQKLIMEVKKSKEIWKE